MLPNLARVVYNQVPVNESTSLKMIANFTTRHTLVVAVDSNKWEDLCNCWLSQPINQLSFTDDGKKLRTVGEYYADLVEYPHSRRVAITISDNGMLIGNQLKVGTDYGYPDSVVMYNMINNPQHMDVIEPYRGDLLYCDQYTHNEMNDYFVNDCNKTFSEWLDLYDYDCHNISYRIGCDHCKWGVEYNNAITDDYKWIPLNEIDNEIRRTALLAIVFAYCQRKKVGTVVIPQSLIDRISSRVKHKIVSVFHDLETQTIIFTNDCSLLLRTPYTADEIRIPKYDIKTNTHKLVTLQSTTDRFIRRGNNLMNLYLGGEFTK